MNEEFKITMPLITETELTKIDNNLHEIVNEFIKMTIKDKDMFLSQHIIKRLEEENKDLQKRLEQKNLIVEKVRNIIEKLEELQCTDGFKCPYFDYSHKEEILNILKEGSDK